MNIWQSISQNWILIGILLFTISVLILFVILQRHYDIDEITFTPPFIKFKRRPSMNESEPLGRSHAVSIKKNKMWGRNKIVIRGEKGDVSENSLLGENEI